MIWELTTHSSLKVLSIFTAKKKLNPSKGISIIYSKSVIVTRHWQFIGIAYLQHNGIAYYVYLWRENTAPIINVAANKQIMNKRSTTKYKVQYHQVSSYYQDEPCQHYWYHQYQHNNNNYDGGQHCENNSSGRVPAWGGLRREGPINLIFFHWSQWCSFNLIHLFL
jgi:hypothetical protein